MEKKIATLALCALLFAFGFPAAAQQPKTVWRIGYLSSGNAASESSRSEAIGLALRERGYIEGQNIATEYRYAEGKVDRAPQLAAELVRLKVDVIVITGGTGWIRAAKNATMTIPIVMVGVGIDPVESGLVESLAPPRRQCHRPYSPFQRAKREAAGIAQRKPFPKLSVLRFSMIQIRQAPSR